MMLNCSTPLHYLKISSFTSLNGPSVDVFTNNCLYCHFEFINRLETIITCFVGHVKVITATYATRLSGVALSIMDQKVADNIVRDNITISMMP